MYEQLLGFGDALESQLGYALRGLFFWGQLLAVWAMSSRLMLKIGRAHV